jgi:hypothetical protein
VEVTITEFGRVELDITKVPTSTVTSKNAPESFEDRLSHAGRSHPNDETRQETERVDTRNPEVPEAAGRGDETSPATDDIAADAAGDDMGGDAHDAADAVGPAAPQDTTSRDDKHQAYPEGGPVGRAAAGKDPGPSSSLLAQGAVRLDSSQGPVSQAPSDGALPLALAGADTQGRQQGPGPQAQPQGQEAKAIAEAFKTAGRAAAKPSTAPVGYRTVNAATLRAAEAARDSVIKQITLRLGPDGGKMRVHLDPPELGRLDIRMVVEKGAVLQLSIAAERPEVLMMLNKHVPELRQALTQQGLDLSSTDVQTGLFEDREHGGGSHQDHGTGPADGQDEFEAAPALRRVGYVTAEGLDFWV